MISSPKRIRALISALAAAIIAVSCAGSPKPNATTTPNAASATGTRPNDQAVSPPGGPGSENFDPTMVTEAVKSATFVDVRALIDSLNLIIRRQDYDAWRSHLTDEYIRVNSDPAVLAKYSEYPIIKRKGITLLTLKDYFINVVYPSRQNDKVDDIEFVGENLIKAITVSPKGDRNILYTLEKHGDAWKIGIGR
jgi:hypothetical protein